VNKKLFRGVSIALLIVTQLFFRAQTSNLGLSEEPEDLIELLLAVPVHEAPSLCKQALRSLAGMYKTGAIKAQLCFKHQLGSNKLICHECLPADLQVLLRDEIVRQNLHKFPYRCMRVLENQWCFGILSPVCSQDGFSVVTAARDGYFLWNLQQDRSVKLCDYVSDNGDPFLFSPDGKFALTKSFKSSFAGRLNLETGEFLQLQGVKLAFEGYKGSVDFSPDGRFFATASLIGRAYLFDTQTGRCLRVFNKGFSGINYSVVFSPSGLLIATVSSGRNQVLDRHFRLWDVQLGTCLYDSAISNLREVKFSPNERTYIAQTQTEDTISLWDWKTERCIQKLEGHSSYVRSVAFSPNGQFLVSASYDQKVHLWDIQTGEFLLFKEEPELEASDLVFRDKHLTSIEFSSDGLFLVIEETVTFLQQACRTISMWKNTGAEQSLDQVLAVLQGNDLDETFEEDPLEEKPLIKALEKKTKKRCMIQ
jgi:WD40 repeat protein